MSINTTVLDPNSYKESLIEYLKTQTVFKDYNFEDSNINVLLDILSHNTYLNSFYKNMIFNESQLDSCLLRSSAVSKAKELRYVPLSKRSATAKIKLTITAENINALEIPKGTHFSGKGNLESYTFVTNKSYISKSSSGTFLFPEIELFEGSYFTDTYIVDSSIEKQNFIVTNSSVDTSSLEVIVIDYNTKNETTFIKKDTSFDLTPESEIYFLEGFNENQYAVEFGKDILGKQPSNGSTVILLYRVVSGADNANYISEFTLDEDIVLSSGGVLLDTIIDTVSSSTGGSNEESIEDIKFKAPRFYSTQESAVTSTDYKSLILKEFSSKLKDVNVIGGEKVKPKKYGKVVIVLKPIGNDITTDTTKNDIYAYIKTYNVGSITPIIIDAENFHLKVNTTVQYDPSITNKYLSDIETLVSTSIISFSKSNLEGFGKDFRYSKFVKNIDDSDKSIISNDTSVFLTKRLIPKINTSEKHYIYFQNKLKSISSSNFNWVNQDGSITNECFIGFSDGILNIVKYDNVNNKINIIEKNIGTVNLNDGTILISKLFVSSFDSVNPYLEIIAETENKDIIISNDKILNITANDIIVNVQKVIS